MTTVDLLALDAIDESRLAQWRDLVARAAEPNPFFEPELLIPALTHLDPNGDVRLLTIRDDDRALAAFPVRVMPKWKHLPGTALVTWRHDYCFLGTPLVDRTALLPAVQALVEHVGSRSARLVVLDWVASDGPVLETFDAAQHARLVMLETFERALLERRTDGDYLAALGKETRRRLGQRRRALERDVGELHMVDRAADAVAYNRFLELEAAGWKGVEGTALASNPAHAAFFREVVARFAEEGRLELRSLETADGTTLAMSVRLVAGDGVFCFKVAHDERYRKYAPGLQLELDTLPEFHARAGTCWADSCTAPGNEFFEGLFPSRRRLASVVLTRRSGAHAMMVRTFPTLRRLRWRLRRAR